MTTAAKNTAPAPDADRPTLAEVLKGFRSDFLETVAYHRGCMVQTRAQFDDLAATDLLRAIATYAELLAKHEARIKILVKLEFAYCPADETGATWVALGKMVDQMSIRLIREASEPAGYVDLIHTGIDASKAAGRADAIREISAMIANALDKIADAAPDPIA